MRGGSLKAWLPVAKVIEAKEKERETKWLFRTLGKLPPQWSALARREHKRRGGVAAADANRYLTDMVSDVGGRLSLAAGDREIREAAIEASRVAQDLARAEMDSGAGHEGVRRALEGHCASWGILPAVHGGEPGLLRMLDERWYLRRIRAAHGRRVEALAIRAGLVKRGLWLYASQDCVDRRQQQRAANARAIDKAVVECEASGESLSLAEVVAGSVANPEVKRAELMVRIKGCDAIATENGDACEFWTLTAPSEYHAQRMAGKVAEVNPAYAGHSPRDGQKYLCRLWAQWRAACHRRGIRVFGLRTAEPHHDGCPHWHIIVYGSARDLRYARRLLRVYALRKGGDDPGARAHRFTAMKLAGGAAGAAYAAKYIAKNINGKGVGGDIDHEDEIRINQSVKRVDSWAAAWGIRQFQFFGCPAISGWRVLRRIKGPVAVVGSMLERARSAADDSDFASYWRAAVAGGLRVIYAGKDKLTEYGDAAAGRIAGICEGARRAMLPEKEWRIFWGGVKKRAVFAFPRSCVYNCTGPENPAAALFAMEA